MMNCDSVLEVLGEIGVQPEWHSFRAVPSSHFFATWNIPSCRFDGADDFTFQKHYTLNITFFYRESKTPEDFRREAEFENAVREMGEWSAVYDYDSEHSLFYTQYTFSITEDI